MAGPRGPDKRDDGSAPPQREPSGRLGCCVRTRNRTNGPMTRTSLALATLLTALSGPALAQTLAPTGGAGNTGVTTPAMQPDEGLQSKDRPLRPAPNVVGNPSPAAVPGSTTGVNVGGTPTSGPPGTGGTAGGPSLSGR